MEGIRKTLVKGFYYPEFRDMRVGDPEQEKQKEVF